MKEEIVYTNRPYKKYKKCWICNKAISNINIHEIRKEMMESANCIHLSVKLRRFIHYFLKIRCIKFDCSHFTKFGVFIFK